MESVEFIMFFISGLLLGLLVGITIMREIGCKHCIKKDFL